MIIIPAQNPGTIVNHQNLTLNLKSFIFCLKLNISRFIPGITQGQRADFGDITIYRMLPNRYSDAVSQFVFPDHIPLVKHSPDKQ